MGASVRIEDEAFGDRRYDRLTQELGLPDADCARGKMAAIWRQCTIEQSYFLDAADVALVLGERGPDAIVAARLAERKGDRLRIKGTKGRIEWLKKLRGNGKFGKLGGRPRKNPQGLSEKPTRVSENSEQETPPAPAPAPAPAPIHDHETHRAAGAAGRLSDEFGALLSSSEQETLKRLQSDRPVTEEELDRAIKTTREKANRPCAAFALTVIESGRKAPPKATSQPRDPRVGYHPGSKEFGEGDQVL